MVSPEPYMVRHDQLTPDTVCAGRMRYLNAPPRARRCGQRTIWKPEHLSTCIILPLYSQVPEVGVRSAHFLIRRRRSAVRVTGAIIPRPLRTGIRLPRDH